jgi:hypothetical protein
LERGGQAHPLNPAEFLASLRQQLKYFWKPFQRD